MTLIRTTTLALLVLLAVAVVAVVLATGNVDLVIEAGGRRPG
jgi:hypothetical protein